MNEKWKTIKNYPYHQVSNLGRVRSIDRTIICSNGREQFIKGQMLSVYLQYKYYAVNIRKKGHKQRIFKIHHLVIKHFGKQKPSSKHEVNHKNGIKSNNCIDNLEWVTKSENEKHAYKLGLKEAMRGSKHPLSKFAENDIVKIRKLNKEGLSTYKLADLYKVSQTTIQSIVTRKTYAHI